MSCPLNRSNAEYLVLARVPDNSAQVLIHAGGARGSGGRGLGTTKAYMALRELITVIRRLDDNATSPPRLEIKPFQPIRDRRILLHLPYDLNDLLRGATHDGLQI